MQHDDSAIPLLDENGIVEYATLELRVHPPSVKIDNTLDEDSTVVIVDSANRPGTLVEVVERLTELGLGVRNAQISSDGGWFVDVFHVTNVEGEKVRDRRTLERIENILDLNFDISPGVPSGGKYQGMNVIEMLLRDEPGLLMRVSNAITKCQLNIFDTLLWSHEGYAAMLFTVAESDQPVRTQKDLLALQRRLEQAIEIKNQKQESLFIQVDCCYDCLYVEKRFYRLKMKAFSIIERAQQQQQQQQSASPATEGRGREPEMDITSRFDDQTRYTTLHVRTRDRPQLLFVTVCTLSDLNVDVFHATIDADSKWANLEFFVKSSSGSEIRSKREIDYIKERLRRALNLGAPPVLCLQVAGDDHKGLMYKLTHKILEAGLDITYCTSRTDPIEMHTCSVFYLLDAKDGKPAVFNSIVEGCCKHIGAKCLSQQMKLKEKRKKDLSKEKENNNNRSSRKMTLGDDIVILLDKMWQGVD